MKAPAMTIWSSERRELEKVFRSIDGQHPGLEKELSRLLKTVDENMVLVYARRCLEVIITDLCECELKRSRGSGPLQGIIDRLHREEKVPHHIIVSMRNLNSLSTFGAHPKEFDPRQVKPVLLDLGTILRWYMNYMTSRDQAAEGPGGIAGTAIMHPGDRKSAQSSGRRIVTIAAAPVLGVAIFLFLFLTGILDGNRFINRSDIQALVILPFENLTGDEQLEYFVSGMHASLIGEIGKVGGIQVKSRTSSNALKDMDLTIPEIASKVGADAALETTVLQLADTIFLQFRLMSGRGKEEQVWAADYREEIGQILNLYTRITKQIAREMMVGLTKDEKRLLDRKQTVDKDAYEAYLRSYQYWEDLSRESLDKAEEYLKLALEKDPDWAPLHAGMAMVWGGRWQMNMVSTEVARPKIRQYLQRANELDPDFADNYFINAIFSVWTDWEWEKGEKEFLRAIAINPNHEMSRIYYAHLLMTLQRMDEAIIQGQLAVELDPLNPLILGLYSVVLKGAGDTQGTLEYLHRALSVDPEHSFALGQMERAYYNAGEYEKSLEISKSWLANDYPAEELEAIDSVYQEQGHIAAYKEIIRLEEQKYYQEHGNPESGEEPLAGLSQLYGRVGEYSKALDALEKRFGAHDPNLPYIVTRRPGYMELRDSSRFVDIVKKMNLPLPE